MTDLVQYESYLMCSCITAALERKIDELEADSTSLVSRWYDQSEIDHERFTPPIESV